MVRAAQERTTSEPVRSACAQRLQHRRRLRAHAAPELETPRPPARPACPSPARRGRRRSRCAQAMNGRVADAVGHVVAGRHRVHDADRDQRHLAAQARRRRVDDQVEALALDAARIRSRRPGPRSSNVAASSSARARPCGSRSRAARLQRRAAARCAPRAAPPAPSTRIRGARPLEAEVARQIGDQPRAVGVVAEQLAVAAHDGVDRIGQLRARREFVDELGGGLLVRQRDVRAAAAAARRTSSTSLRNRSGGDSNRR